MITRVSKVIVPVQDQQAALDFWTTCLEFTIVRDDSYGDERWIEIKPPNQDLLLVLSPRRPDEPRRTVHDRLPHSDLFFDCADIEQTHRRLSRRGVRFPLPPANNILAGGRCSRTTKALATTWGKQATTKSRRLTPHYDASSRTTGSFETRMVSGDLGGTPR